MITHILVPIEALNEGKLSRSDINYIYNSFAKVDLSEESIKEKSSEMMLFKVDECHGILFQGTKQTLPTVEVSFKDRAFSMGYQQAIRDLLNT